MFVQAQKEDWSENLIAAYAYRIGGNREDVVRPGDAEWQEKESEAGKQEILITSDKNTHHEDN